MEVFIVLVVIAVIWVLIKQHNAKVAYKADLNLLLHVYKRRGWKIPKITIGEKKS